MAHQKRSPPGRGGAESPGASTRWWVEAARTIARATSGHTVLVLTAGLGAVLVAGLSTASAAVYDAVVDKDGVAGLDRPALAQAIAWRTPLDERIITWFGSGVHRPQLGGVCQGDWGQGELEI